MRDRPLPNVEGADLPSKREGPGWEARSAEMLHFARACWPGPGAREQSLLALHIAIIGALDDALETAPPLASLTQEYQSLLPWRVRGQQADNHVHEVRAHIRDALVELETGLASCSRPGYIARDGALRWWRKQARMTVAAMRQESLWRISGSIPDEASYLSVAQRSIAVDWLAASLWILDGATSPPQADSRFLTATRDVALAVRLANDLYDTERERREGKVVWLSVRARALEAKGWTWQRVVRRARAELEDRVVQSAERAFGALAPRRWKGSARLRTALTGMLRAALDLYVPGLRERARPTGDTPGAAAQVTPAERRL